MNLVDQLSAGQTFRRPINECGGHWQFDNYLPIGSTIHQNQMWQNHSVGGKFAIGHKQHIVGIVTDKGQ